LTQKQKQAEEEYLRDVFPRGYSIRCGHHLHDDNIVRFERAREKAILKQLTPDQRSAYQRLVKQSG
jgi:hypothetical protein